MSADQYQLWNQFQSGTRIALHVFSRPSDQTGVMFADGNVLLQKMICANGGLTPTLNPDRGTYNVWMFEVNPSANDGVPTYTGNGDPNFPNNSTITMNGGPVSAGTPLSCAQSLTYYVLSIPSSASSPPTYSPCVVLPNCVVKT
jgi:hypothetical protein